MADNNQDYKFSTQDEKDIWTEVLYLSLTRGCGAYVSIEAADIAAKALFDRLLLVDIQQTEHQQDQSQIRGCFHGNPDVQ